MLGCASASRFHTAGPVSATSLGAYLDRWDSWISLSTQVKLRAEVDGSAFQARGRLLYLIGERYELGFTKPYNLVLGNLYMTPTQLVYWNSAGKPHVFGAGEPMDLGEFMPVGLPNWDPRDLLPFPVGGRSGGFQVDTLWHDGQRSWIIGRSEDAEYRFTLDNRTGHVTTERVNRNGRDPVVKRYQRVRRFDGWPIARRVVCSDTTGGVSVTWRLGEIALDAERRMPQSEAAQEPSGVQP